MPRALTISSPGEGYRLSIQDVALPAIKPTEVRIRQKACGINHHDIMQGLGLRPVQENMVPGIEGVGIVEEMGEEVEGIEIGDRVAYATCLSGGGYAEEVIVDQNFLVHVPEFTTNKVAAGLFSKGCVAHLLVRRAYFVRPGNFILIYGAAGGVGHILAQWSKYLEAHPIGVVSTPEKAVFATKAGCDHVIVSTQENIVDRVGEITKGHGVRAVYDSIGKDMFETSIQCLNTFGLYASYGVLSGEVPPIDMNILRPKGIFATSADPFLYKNNRMELLLTADDIFMLSKEKTIKSKVTAYPFEDAMKAHEDMRARKTIGSNILVFE